MSAGDRLGDAHTALTLAEGERRAFGAKGGKSGAVEKQNKINNKQKKGKKGGSIRQKRRFDIKSGSNVFENKNHRCNVDESANLNLRFAFFNLFICLFYLLCCCSG